MSIIATTIRPSSTFAGRFEVVALHCDVLVEGLVQRVRREVIPCHNLASARTIKRNLERTPDAVATSTEPTPNLELSCGCVAGGLGHTPAVTWALSGRVERVHNWATARTLVRRHPVGDELLG